MSFWVQALIPAKEEKRKRKLHSNERTFQLRESLTQMLLLLLLTVIRKEPRELTTALFSINCDLTWFPLVPRPSSVKGKHLDR